MVIGIQEGSATLQAGLEPVVIVQSRDGTANGKVELLLIQYRQPNTNQKDP